MSSIVFAYRAADAGDRIPGMFAAFLDSQ